MKIKQQLLWTHGMLVFLSLLIVFINVIVYTGMESDANIINQSGKLRAISYNMVQLSNQINNQASNNGNGDLNLVLKQRIEEFDDILVMLGESRENSILGIHHDLTLIKLEKLVEEWNGVFKPAYLKIVDNELTDITSAQITKNIDSYVDNIHKMVTFYSEHARQKVMKGLAINGGLMLLIIVVTVYSLTSTNQRIRKPMDTLMQELKELSFIGDEVSERLKNIDTDEITEMSQYFSEMMYDQLTKTLNRRSGLAKLSRILQNASENSLKMSLCFIDINGLKDVNDYLGHRFGDELIVSAVDAIQKEIRYDDFIIRMGGDEFLVVFRGIGSDAAEKVWKRIKRRYEMINDQEQRQYLISVSHGIVEYKDCHGSDIESLIKCADDKMYDEKRYIKEELKVQIIRSIKRSQSS